MHTMQCNAWLLYGGSSPPPRSYHGECTVPPLHQMVWAQQSCGKLPRHGDAPASLCGPEDTETSPPNTEAPLTAGVWVSVVLHIVTGMRLVLGPLGGVGCTQQAHTNGSTPEKHSVDNRPVMISYIGIATAVFKNFILKVWKILYTVILGIGHVTEF